MIISASYKTDIPAFYGGWFMKRLEAGFCKVINPFNRKAFHVSLKREDVDGIVFWTKNIQPFMSRLADVHQKGYPFVVQHTINNYPRQLETNVVNAAKAIENLKRIADTYGNRVCVWRYDTIIFSDLTPYEWHLDSFHEIARQLHGYVDEVVISYLQAYQKTQRNLKTAGHEGSFKWEDPNDSVKCSLTHELKLIAEKRDITLSVCSQPLFASGCKEARCIDADRLADVAKTHLDVPLKGMRKDCGCFASKDIGEYDTCPHGCVYCYAVRNQDAAKGNYKMHDPENECLLTEYDPAKHEKRKGGEQLNLF